MYIHRSRKVINVCLVYTFWFLVCPSSTTSIVCGEFVWVMTLSIKSGSPSCLKRLSNTPFLPHFYWIYVSEWVRSENTYLHVFSGDVVLSFFKWSGWPIQWTFWGYSINTRMQNVFPSPIFVVKDVIVHNTEGETR